VRVFICNFEGERTIQDLESLPEVYFLFFKFNQEFVVAIPEDPFIIMKHTSVDVVALMNNSPG